MALYARPMPMKPSSRPMPSFSEAEDFGYVVSEPTELELAEQKMKDEIGLADKPKPFGSAQDSLKAAQERIRAIRPTPRTGPPLPTLNWNDPTILRSGTPVNPMSMIEDLPEMPPNDPEVHESWEYNNNTGRYQAKKQPIFARFKAWLAKKS